ncbi:MAG: hypothetical protein Q9187_008883, partial [Circinaria calcarea]
MSASPAPSNADQQNKGEEQITFRFCRECSNMLYPKEDRMSNTLMFACRTCQFSEPAISSCVFRNTLYNTVGETAGVTQDVGADPTVGLPDFCTLCGQEILCFICGDECCVELVCLSLANDGKSPLDEETEEEENKLPEERDSGKQQAHLGEL